MRFETSAYTSQPLAHRAFLQAWSDLPGRLVQTQNLVLHDHSRMNFCSNGPNFPYFPPIAQFGHENVAPLTIEEPSIEPISLDELSKDLVSRL